MGDLQPNAARAVYSIVRSLVTVPPPKPTGGGVAPDIDGYAEILNAVAVGGTGVLVERHDEVSAVVAGLSGTDPDTLDRSAALAFWLDLYNAGALELAGRAARDGVPSVLRVPGAFDSPFTDVAGREMSLEDVEHGKIRRFRDPRIHGALVCGSVSCPTLRATPYTARPLDEALDDQMRAFLSGGAAAIDGDRLLLSRVFAWFGADFVRPHRMPAWIPPRRATLLASIDRWLPPHVADVVRTESPTVSFQPYDWGLRCSVG